jgi:hypothetical protein
MSTDTTTNDAQTAESASAVKVLLSPEESFMRFIRGLVLITFALLAAESVTILLVKYGIWLWRTF